jgi:hypothetical protein
MPHIQIAHFLVQYGFLVGFSPDRVERHGRGWPLAGCPRDV